MKITKFKKFSKRLFRYVFLIPFIFTIVVSIATSCSTYFLYKNSFERSINNNISLLVSRFEITNSDLNSKLSSTCNNSLFVEAVKNKEENKISTDLISLSASDSMIIGSFFYSTGLTVTSSEVSGAPTYTEMISLNEVSSFMGSDKLSMSLVRDQSISQAYHTYPFDKSLGVFSLFHKVVSEDHTLGFVEIDISTTDLYSNVLNLQGHHYMKGCSIILHDINTILKMPGTEYNLDIAAIKSHGSIKKYKGNSIISKEIDKSKINSDSLSISLIVPNSNLGNLILFINFSIFGADLLLTACFLLIAYLFSKKDSRRLENIATKIEEEESTRLKEEEEQL